MASLTRTDVSGVVPERGTPNGHLPALDGLRGVAVLLVLLTHGVALPLEPVSNAFDSAVHTATKGGWIGVDLFFVLSGFLITGILLDTRNEPRRWSRFFARRALRIFPLYYAVLLVLFVILPRIIDWSEPEFLTLRANQSWYWGYAVNFLQVLTKGTGTTLNTVHFWSLSVEEQFYVFWPFVVWSCRPRTLFRIAGVIAVLGLAVRLWFATSDPFGYPAAPFVFTPVRLDSLMMGAVLATLARSDGGLIRFRGFARVVAPVGALSLALVGIPRGATEPMVGAIGLPLIAITFGALLVVALTAPAAGRFERLVSSPFLRSWGKYSYGVYVFHYLLIFVVTWFLPFHRYQSPWLGGSRVPAVLLFALLISATSYVVAWASYNLYEKRFLALKRYFEREPANPLPETAEPAPARLLGPAPGA